MKRAVPWESVFILVKVNASVSAESSSMCSATIPHSYAVVELVETTLVIVSAGSTTVVVFPFSGFVLYFSN